MFWVVCSNTFAGVNKDFIKIKRLDLALLQVADIHMYEDSARSSQQARLKVEKMEKELKFFAEHDFIARWQGHMYHDSINNLRKGMLPHAHTQSFPHLLALFSGEEIWIADYIEKKLVKAMLNRSEAEAFASAPRAVATTSRPAVYPSTASGREKRVLQYVDSKIGRAHV